MIDLLCLLEFYNTYEHDGTYFEMAQKMIDNFENLGNMGAQELADYLFVSPSTLYRFVKMMGYDNHGQMRMGQLDFMGHYMERGRYFPQEQTGTCSLLSCGDYFCDIIKKVSHQVREEDIKSVFKAFLQTDSTVFVSMPTPSSIWRLQIELVLLGKRTSAFMNPQHQLEAVEELDENGLLFLLQLDAENSYLYYEALDKAREKKAFVVLLTALPMSPLIEKVDASICFHGTMTESDTLAVNFILEVIGNRLYQEVLKKRIRI